MSNRIHFTIVTGLSGAGKTQAMKALEDLDFFCIDNLPPMLLPDLVEAHAQSALDRQYAIAIDIRLGEYFSHLRQSLEWLQDNGHSYRLIFLDCSDSVLVKRFSETRRVHPLAKGQSIFDSISAERQLLSDARTMADEIIDTSDLRPMDLRLRLNQLFRGDSPQASFSVDLFSFGFKYGAPVDADITFDVRFIPNPFYIDELKPQTGKDQPVVDYVLQFPVTQAFLGQFSTLVQELIPAYSREGKIRLTIGIGCTGGQHRSVAIAEELGHRLKEAGFETAVRHREFTNPSFGAEGHVRREYL